MIRPIILFDKINNINSMFSYVTVSASEVYIALVCMYLLELTSYVGNPT